MQPWITELVSDSRLFLAVLLHFVWQATIVIAVVAVGRNLIHPRFFRARYILSVVGLVVVLLAPLITVGYYATNTEALQALQPPAAEVFTGAAALVDAPAATSWLEDQFHVVFYWFDTYRSWWLSGWLLGFGLLVLRLGVSLGHCIRIRKGQTPLPPHLEKLASQLKSKLNITRNIVVAASQDITQAVATGIIKPVVLVPASWVTQLPVSAIEAVLAHELAHIKRWDLWINLLQRITETVFFFHPLVWWLSRRISSEREICCDQLAIQITGKPMRYVETLAHVAGTPSLDDFDFQFSTAFVGGKKMNLLRRAKMILEPASMDAGSPVRALTLTLCVGLLATCGSYACCNASDGTLQEHETETEEVELHEIEVDTDTEADVRYAWVVRDQQEAVVSDIHRHLGELLHAEGQNHDPRELARQLRKIADQLEAKNNQPHARRVIRRRKKAREVEPGNDIVHEEDANHRIRIINDSDQQGRFRWEVRPEGKVHRIHEADEHAEVIMVDDDGKKGSYRIRLHHDGDSSHHDDDSSNHDSDEYRVLGMVVESDEGDWVQKERSDRYRVIRQSDDKRRPRYRVRAQQVEGDEGTDLRARLQIRENEFHAAGEDDKPRYRVRAKQVDGDEGTDLRARLRLRERDVHPGHGETSRDDLGGAIRELRNEVRQLRHELNQLRKHGNEQVDVWHEIESDDIRNQTRRYYQDVDAWQEFELKDDSNQTRVYGEVDAWQEFEVEDGRNQTRVHDRLLETVQPLTVGWIAEATENAAAERKTDLNWWIGNDKDK